jgi:hypothetical protein
MYLSRYIQREEDEKADEPKDNGSAPGKHAFHHFLFAICNTGQQLVSSKHPATHKSHTHHCQKSNKRPYQQQGCLV